MPSKSAKQHRFMEMIAHGGKPKKKGAPSKAVAQDFVDADNDAETAADKEAEGFRQDIVKRNKKIRSRRRR